MKPFRLSLIQARYDAAPDAVANTYRQFVAGAAQSGANLVVLPELSYLPYFPATPRQGDEPEILPEAVPGGDGSKHLSELAAQNRVCVAGSVYERGGLGFRKQKGARFSATVLFDTDGNLGALCRKQHVSGDTEGAYYGIGNSDYPTFALPDVRVALPTGYDAYFPELARIFALKGAELLVFPSAVAASDVPAWTVMLQSHAVANGVFVAGANRVGVENGVLFGGQSVIVAPDGTILAHGSPDAEEAVSTDLDPAILFGWRERFPHLLRREPETYGVVLGRLTLNTPDAGQ